MRYPKDIACGTLAAWMLLLVVGFAPGEAQAARPNILLVVADDYGVDSCRLYNANPKASLPPTPHIDSLYETGVLFRNAYSYPSCSATRAAMLTGRFGFRTGWGIAIDVNDSTVLLENEPTLPRILTANPQLGYSHASIGKWHLGFQPSDPNVRGGWSHFSGALSHSLESYSRWTKVVDGVSGISTNYATTENVNDALAWIRERGTNNWFLWLAFNAPHEPFHKPPEGLHSYGSLSTSPSAITRTPRPYYEAMTEAMDREFGRLLDSIDRANTVVIFVGDNGTPGSVIQPPYASDRAKFTLYEGGIHVPLIISGPGVRNPRRDVVAPVHVVDLYATILELAGADVAKVLPQGVTIDSRSLLPALQDDPDFHRDWVFAEQFPAPDVAPAQKGRAIRDETLKLVRWTGGTRAVYDLVVDPTENTNLLGHLTADQAARVAALEAQLGRLQIQPRLSDVRFQSNRLAFTTEYVQGVSYSLQRSSNALAGSWKTIGASKVRTNFSVIVTDAQATDAASFYRVTAPER